jgi:hypothetical protein
VLLRLNKESRKTDYCNKKFWFPSYLLYFYYISFQIHYSRFN